MYHPVSYIDHNIIIQEHIPKWIQFIIDEMEEYDKTGSVMYFSSMDDFVDAAKNGYTHGCYSETTWKNLEEKYVYHALMVSEWEDKQNGNKNL